MHPLLKKVLIYASILIGLAVLTAITIAYLNEDRIRSLVIHQINTALETEATVESIEFSLLQQFPKASIRFNRLRIEENSKSQQKDALIEADQVFLQFDPWDLLTGRYVIDEILISDAKIRLIYFKDGSRNFDLFKKDTSDHSFQLSLKKVVVKNSQLSYINQPRKEEFDTRLHSMTLAGLFDETVFDLNAKAVGNMEKFDLQSFQLNRPYPYDLDLLLTINQEEESYAFQKAGLQLGDLKFQLTGVYKNNVESSIDLAFKGVKNRIPDLQELLPKESRQKFEGYNFKGDIDITGKIQGYISERNSPAINMKFEIHQGSFKHDPSGLHAEDLFARGTYSNGNLHSSKSSLIQVDSIYLKSDAGVAFGNISLSDLSNPLIDSKLFADVDLAELKKMIKTDSLEILRGQAHISLTGTMLADSLSKLSKSNLQTAQVSGHIRLYDAGFRWTGMTEEISGMNGDFHFEKNVVQLDSLSSLWGETQLHLKGQVYNLFPFLFFEDEALKLHAEVYSPSIDLTSFFVSREEKSSSSAAASDRIEAMLKIHCDQLTYRKFKATDVYLELKLKQPVIIVQDISFRSMQGLVAGWLQIESESDNRLLLKTQLSLEGIDVHEMFEQWEDFGQKAIVAENLKGKANVGIEFNGRFQPDFSIIKESIYTSAKIDILNGELINYQPALALSKYIDIEELKHIKFSRMVNEIEIINQVVYLPEMEIKSSALELKLSGKHSFNNEIEYHFQLWLNDFLFRKAKRSKKNQTEFGEVEQDESGRAKLFIRMEGTVEDYTIKLDRKAMRKVWNENMTEERNVLNKLFREEFKGEKSESKKAPKNFAIEWEGMEQEDKKTGGQEDNKTGELEDKKTGGQEGKRTDKKEKKPKWFEKGGEPIKDEYETYDPKKLD